MQEPVRLERSKEGGHHLCCDRPRIGCEVVGKFFEKEIDRGNPGDSDAGLQRLYDFPK